MTVKALLDYVRGTRDNAFKDEVLLQWTNEVEAVIQIDVMLLDVSNVKAHTLTTESLICDEAHTKLYWMYLYAMICYANSEFKKYQDYVDGYNQALREYSAWYAMRYNPAGGTAEAVGYYISAYSLAVKHGYTGTEDEWIAAVESARTSAESAATAAAASQSAAAESATAAAASQTAAAASAVAAKSSEDAVAANAAAAATSESAAKVSEMNAKTSETEAAKSRDAAAASQNAAAGSETKAASSETAAGKSASAAFESATAAKTSETAAASSETNAKASETASANSQSAAAFSASAAAASETNAKSSETEAAGSASDAAASRTAAAGSASTAAESQSAAKASETNAAASASASKTSETNAKSSETAAAGSATTAAEKAEAAASSAAAAAASETAAKGSETAAAGSASAAKTSELAAAAAKTAAESARAAADGRADDAEAWAVGQRGGVDVSATDPTYHNSSKYYKEQASAIVGGDYPTKAEAQGYVDTHNQASGAHAALFKAQSDALAAHTARTDNPHGVTAAQIGLGSVDNTADSVKPVSTAQASAIAAAKSEAITAAASDATAKASSAQTAAKTYTDSEIAKIPAPDMSAKADKKVPAAAGNLATLDSTGNLADSGKTIADFATTAQIGDIETVLKNVVGAVT